jgi:hypothetical protein
VEERFFAPIVHPIAQAPSGKKGYQEPAETSWFESVQLISASQVSRRQPAQQI